MLAGAAHCSAIVREDFGAQSYSKDPWQPKHVLLVGCNTPTTGLAYWRSEIEPHGFLPRVKLLAFSISFGSIFPSQLMTHCLQEARQCHLDHSHKTPAERSCELAAREGKGGNAASRTSPYTQHPKTCCQSFCTIALKSWWDQLPVQLILCRILLPGDQSHFKNLWTLLSEQVK